MGGMPGAMMFVANRE